MGARVRYIGLNRLFVLWNITRISLYLSFLLFCINIYAFQVDSEIGKGDAFFENQNFDAALMHYLKADSIERVSNVRSSEVSLKLGKTYRNKDSLALSSQYLLTAINLAESSNELDILIEANINQGSVYGMLELFDLSIEYFQKGASYSRKINDTAGLSKSLMGIGTVSLFLGDFNLSAKSFSESIKQFRLLGDSTFEARALSNLSETLRIGGKLDSALLVSHSVIQLFENLRDSLGIAQSYHNKGLIQFQLGSYESALESYEKSLDISRLLDSKYDVEKAWYGMAVTHRALGNDRVAFDYLNLYQDSHYEPDTDQIQKAYDISLKDLRTGLQSRIDSANQEIVFMLIASACLLIMIVFLYLNYRRQKTKKLFLIEKNDLANQKINSLLQQQEIHSLQGVLAGQEEERQRIATDLHDKLGAILGMVKLHFSAVEERIDDLRDDNKKQYAKANELLDQASSEVRNISHNLLSGVLVKFGLVPALRDLKQTVEATGKLKVQLVVGDQVGIRLSGEQELQVYRIVQELISNILKHAKATEAVIQLNRTNGTVNLIVEDNGTGFNVEAARQKSGIGLKNLEARAAKLNAQIHFDSGKGAGTTVSVDIPVENEKL